MTNRSPFPGMDPYLERHWGDIHHMMIGYARDALNERLPADLRCQVEERVYVGADPAFAQTRKPDAFVIEQPEGVAAVPAPIHEENALAVAEVEPITVLLEPEPIHEAYLQIVDVATGRQVVTVIEFLSPTNKLPGAGRREYIQKRQEYRESGVNTVEIDLTREGPRRAVLPLGALGPKRFTTYHVCTWRAAQPKAIEFYAIPLDKRLPRVKVPLRPEDQEVRLDLQALVDQAYSRGRYVFLDYTQPPDPPLGERDGPVAAEILKAAGKR